MSFHLLKHKSKLILMTTKSDLLSLSLIPHSLESDSLQFTTCSIVDELIGLTVEEEMIILLKEFDREALWWCSWWVGQFTCCYTRLLRQDLGQLML
ncbi:hypothetical protein Leryth_025577 [Lithospermum erythrorhizon]|nr:hypothetical protein Leryth_025577 [Lithospermum erythrorhizon]